MHFISTIFPVSAVTSLLIFIPLYVCRTLLSHSVACRCLSGVLQVSCRYLAGVSTAAGPFRAAHTRRGNIQRCLGGSQQWISLLGGRMIKFLKDN